MKKIFLIIGVCVILLGMSTATAISIHKIKNINSEKIITSTISADPENAPNWAVGNFTGKWGLNVWGADWLPLGCVEGYYGKGFHWNVKIGRLLIEYARNDEENSSKLEGIFFGPYLLGKATDENGNETAFVGIGSYNETNFRWRVMGEVGPTLYMKGTFAKFE